MRLSFSPTLATLTPTQTLALAQGTPILALTLTLVLAHAHAVALAQVRLSFSRNFETRDASLTQSGTSAEITGLTTQIWETSSLQPTG